MRFPRPVNRPNIALRACLLLAAIQTVANAAGSYAPDQADRGRRLFATYCAACHGDALQGAIAPPLTGPAFTQKWGQASRTADDFFYVMRSSMPQPRSGSLTEGQYLDVLAFILSQNGMAPGNTALSPDPAMLATLRVTTGVGGDSPPEVRKKLFIAGENGMTPHGKGPSAADLRAAAGSTDWLYHTHDLRGTRYSPLKQLDPDNVGRLQVACIYQVGSVENFMTGPIVYDGTMYVTTAMLTVAIDAATCRERWRYKWELQDTVSTSTANRGVAIQDGYVVRGTPDGYLLALDAADGKLLWARQVARPAAHETITVSPLIYEDIVLIGPAFSETNVQGWIGAFRLADGSPVWRFNTIPKAGEPGFETWSHDPTVPVGGGAVWSPMSLDAGRGELYVAVANPVPQFPAHLRPGANLYTNSLLALNVRSGKLNWYVQLVANDNKDWDLTQVSPIIEAQVGGRQHKLVITSGKDGIVRVLDRDTHKVLHQTLIGTRVNADQPITSDGTHYCPGILGGIQWNGPAWHPDTQSLYVPSVDWCTTAKVDERPRLIPGTVYSGGSRTMDALSQGFLTAIDLASGKVRWQYRSEDPMVAAVTTTGGGLVFTGELTGDLLALDADKGTVLYRFNTGGALTAGVVTYAINRKQYIGAASGGGTLRFAVGRGAPTIVVFTLPTL